MNITFRHYQAKKIKKTPTNISKQKVKAKMKIVLTSTASEDSDIDWSFCHVCLLMNVIFFLKNYNRKIHFVATGDVWFYENKEKVPTKS